MNTLSDIDAMRRTAASDMQANFEKVIAENPMKIDTARRATATFFVDKDYIRIWNKQLTKADLESEGFLTHRQRAQFLEHLNIQYSQLITDKMDPLTRVFVRSYMKDRRGFSWFLRWPACILSNFKKEGTFGCIDGVPRSGKTSLACTFMDMFWNEFKLESITNIVVVDKPDYISYGTRFSDILRFILEKKRWVLVLDETATFADKKRSMSETNIDFENLNRFIGKQGGSLLMITHSFEKDVPTRLQEWCTEQYTKLGTNMMRCNLRGQNYKGSHYVDDIPDYKEGKGFLTNATTSLDYDISFATFLKLIQRGKTPQDVLAELTKEEDSGPTLKEQVISLLKAGTKQADIARALGCTPGYVAQVKKASLIS